LGPNYVIQPTCLWGLRVALVAYEGCQELNLLSGAGCIIPVSHQIFNIKGVSSTSVGFPHAPDVHSHSCGQRLKLPCSRTKRNLKDIFKNHSQCLFPDWSFQRYENSRGQCPQSTEWRPDKCYKTWLRVWATSSGFLCRRCTAIRKYICGFSLCKRAKRLGESTKMRSTRIGSKTHSQTLDFGFKCLPGYDKEA
jgi:hypothetical protein